jgi:hypothetical protein
LPICQFLLSDVGPDDFLVPADGRDKVTARPEFVAQKIPHLAFDILRHPIHIELFSLSCPMICATEYLGGIEINM